ncbi:dihydrolipoamide acetyltransferase family protein [Aureitalea marina]|uniref:Dihydrolipoamide acetyltransferase component of pyruvate dehydrogenase complex n=1 Tax=Aureitalea marina TaxID=930804 RepID=A0A2S7KQY0_9FLAO|nr:dihydrolipoamide acetyltransferase family protein [Aureitalea marina]PQB05026.1 2-oxoglutarate dehydrogenase [Aureitalea marina]
MANYEFKMPRLGESITEAAIIQWHKSVGDYIEIDEILLEVATDKVDSEVPATVSGTITEILFQPNEVVGIGDVIARLDTDGEVPLEVKSASKPTKKETKTESRPQKKQAKRAMASAVSVNENLFVSPLVDQIARTHHISYEELARIPATGKDGRLRKSDVMQYLDDGRPFQFAQPAASNGFQVPDLQFDKGTGRVVEMDRMRQMIADHMVFSKHTSPHVTAYVEADLTEMVNWRNVNKEGFQKKYDQKLTFTPLFIQCISKAIAAFPMINSSLDGDKIIVKENINIGMATALPSGNLIVPVVRKANELSLDQLAAKTNELASKARDGKLSADDTSGSTFTISNVGTFGSLMGTPIINQPEAAILATGIIKKRAEVMERPEGDSIEIRQMMMLSLSFDHRIVDGYLAGSFLRRIADEMEGYDTSQTF